MKTIKTKQLQKGFTLIEVLLVIVLIGILIAIGLVSFNTEARFIDARNDIRKTHMQTLESAITQYKLREGKYPEGLSRNYQEICDPEATGCTGFFNLKQFLVPNYLQSIPQDPNDTDTTGGTGYSIAVDETTNIVSVRLKESLREGGVIIAVNDPLPAELTTVTANTPLAATVPVNPPPNFNFNSTILGGSIIYGGVSNGTIGIPYTGGLGQAYNGISLSSTGVTGLTASLTSGSLANGAGILSFNITGTASGVGTATFTIPDIAEATGSFTVQICPSNYIRVPGSSLYGTRDFCVMKYEAKTGSATVAATTQAAGAPTVSISQTNSITACSLNGAGYGLINNREWMTIARNIEAQSVNWTGGAVGNGGLWRGHSDNNPSSALAASTDDDPYFGTNNSGTSIERRTHTLSNGETIWDLSGNVWEWTSDTILGKDQPTGSSTGFNWRQYTAITNYGTLSYDLVRPSNPAWNSTQNMGQIYSDGTSTNNTTFAFLRGGYWFDTSFAGVFTLLLFSAPSGTGDGIGFRCVLRFPPATPPAIVTNGLVLNLDAGNPASYPGTGNTWFDLSGNGNNGTLVNGVGYNSDNGGSLVFDGVNDIVDSINASSLTNMTIEIWIYDTRTSGERDILTYNGNSGSYTFNGSVFRTDGNGLYGRYFFSVGQPPFNQWYRFCYIKNGDLYINQTKYIGSAYNGSGSDQTYGILSFGNTRDHVNSRLNGKISSIKIYNRNLSDSEVQQNFNALRGRFDL